MMIAIRYVNLRTSSWKKLDGNSLHERKDAFTQEQINSIYEETGRIDKEINRIACPCFGYPGQPEFQGEDWYMVFRRMLEAGINDARNGNVDLKIPVDELLRYLERDKDFFRRGDRAAAGALGSSGMGTFLSRTG